MLALYEKPLSEEEPVVCIDEKPVVLHADVRPPRPIRLGRILRRDSEYKREGTANCHLRRGAESRTALHPRNSEPLLAAVRRLSGGDCLSLSPGQDHPSGAG